MEIGGGKIGVGNDNPEIEGRQYMAATVDVFAFIGGHIKTTMEKLIRVTDEREMGPHVIPVPFYVIRHGEEMVAFDTGMNERCAVDPEAHWGREVLDVPIIPDMAVRDAFDAQLKTQLGIKIKDLKGLILSHGHLDHAGSVHLFQDTDVPIYVQRAELEAIRAKEPGYMPGDYGDLDKLRFEALDGVFDVFQDQTVVAFPVPGHTPGMQSLMVKIDDANRYVLTSDALDSMDQLERMLLPWAMWDESKVIQTFNTLKLLRAMGVEIVPSHDPEYWKNRPLAPSPFK